MDHKITKYAGEKVCFILFIEGDKIADFKGYLLEGGKVVIDSFMHGRIGKHEFERFTDSDTFLIKGIGRGRKPQQAVNDMKTFIKNCLEANIN